MYETAIHEAGHAVAAFLLGATVHAGCVTVLPTAGYDGICFTGRGVLLTSREMGSLGLPQVLLPARLRRRYEGDVMVALAGQVAVDLYLTRGEPEIVTHAGSDHEPVVLPDREQVALDRAAAADTLTDIGVAISALSALHSGDHRPVQAHLGFLETETEILLGTPRAARGIRALAGELMAHGTLRTTSRLRTHC
jgi:hypothetical protein